MFYYYGAKHRLAHLYDAPRHDVIVEPFAGSAGYAMHWLTRSRRLRAILVERDPRVADAWRRLLSMTPEQIAAMRVPDVGEQTSDFLVMTASASNSTAGCKRKKVNERWRPEIVRMFRRMAAVRAAIGDRVEVLEGDYTDAPDIEATFFVDPPYQATRTRPQGARGAGDCYARGCGGSDLDFAALGAWCRARRGQVIACDYASSTWLPFERLASVCDSVGRAYTEGVWTNVQNPQLGLFGH